MQYISTLERKGFLDRHARKARALVTPVQKVRISDIPIYGQIPAGMATLTEQTVLGHVSLDARSANASRNARMFALKVRGDSMLNAHILDGDIVILDDRKEARNGDIVAALIDGETTLKRFVIEHGRPHLRAENPRYPNQRPAHDLRIQGVMVSLIRRQLRPDKAKVERLAEKKPGILGSFGIILCRLGLKLCSLEHIRDICHARKWQRGSKSSICVIFRATVSATADSYRR